MKWIASCIWLMSLVYAQSSQDEFDISGQGHPQAHVGQAWSEQANAPRTLHRRDTIPVFDPIQMEILRPIADYRAPKYSEVDLGFPTGAPQCHGFKRGWYAGSDATCRTFWRLKGTSDDIYLVGGTLAEPNFYNTQGLDQGYADIRFIAKIPCPRTNVYIPKFCRGVLDYNGGNPYIACMDFDRKTGRLMNQYEFLDRRIRYLDLKNRL